MIEIQILKKKHNANGNPVYEVLIPKVTGKVKGLRKLKATSRFSFSSYNLNSYLKDYVFKGKKIKIMDLR